MITYFNFNNYHVPLLKNLHLLTIYILFNIIISFTNIFSYFNAATQHTIVSVYQYNLIYVQL